MVLDIDFNLKLKLLAFNTICLFIGLIELTVCIWKTTTSIAIYHLLGAVTAIAVFLIVLAGCGLIVAWFQHTKALMAYTVGLFFLCILHVSVGGACLATGSSQLVPVVVNRWRSADADTRLGYQHLHACCGYLNPNLPQNDPSGLGHPKCNTLSCCDVERRSACCTGDHYSYEEYCPCEPCEPRLLEDMKNGIRVVGVTSVIFSLFMLFGVMYITVYLLQEYRRTANIEEEQQEPEENVPYERLERF